MHLCVKMPIELILQKESPSTLEKDKGDKKEEELRILDQITFGGRNIR